MSFGLFSSKPPLPARQKAWTETRMCRLADKFGRDRLLNAEVLLPDDPEFPDPYEGTPGDIRCILDRVGRCMQVDTASIQFELCEDEDIVADRGRHLPGLISLAESELDDPEGMIAVIARELAHELFAQHHIANEVPDAASVTDLLTIYLGLGIFTANVWLREPSVQMGHYRFWSLRHYRYLSSQQIGYALALFAWVRGEDRPPWAAFLRPDAAETLAAALRYLKATEESLFCPLHCGRAESPIPWRSLLERIEKGTPSTCIAALWELAERPGDSHEDLWQAVPLVGGLLHHDLSDVRAESARALAAFGQSAEPLLDELLNLLGDANNDVRSAAAYALGRLSLRPEKVLPWLVTALDEELMLGPATAALADFGPMARPAMPNLTAALAKALGKTDYDKIDHLVNAIQKIAADPAAEFRQIVDECDPELRPQAVAIFAELVPTDLGLEDSEAWFEGDEEEEEE